MMQFTHSNKVPFPMILIIILAGILGLISTDIYAPSLPLIPTIFNTSYQYAQLTISLFLAAFGITQLIAGMLSDIFGRKPILNYGLVIFLMGTILCIFSQSILTLLIGRIIQGVGVGCVSVLSRILLKDIFKNIQQMAKVGSYLAAFIGISPALAPVLGGWIQEAYGISAVFAFLFVFSIILFILNLIYLPETNSFKNLHTFSIKNIYDKYKRVLVNKQFWINVIATGCALSIIITFAVINPFIFQNLLHLSPAEYGESAFFAMFGMCIGMIVNGRFVNIFGIRVMMIFGMIMIIACGLICIIYHFFFPLNTFFLVIITFMATLASAFILSNAVMGAFSPFPDIAGTVGALYGCIQILITSIVNNFISLMHIPTLLDLGLIILVLMITSLIVFIMNLSELNS